MVAQNILRVPGLYYIVRLSSEQRQPSSPGKKYLLSIAIYPLKRNVTRVRERDHVTDISCSVRERAAHGRVFMRQELLQLT